MEKEQIIKHVERIRAMERQYAHGALAASREFLTACAGPNSEFVKSLSDLKGNTEQISFSLYSILTAFIEYVKNDLLRTVSFEREIQIDTVSDYLEQAQTLLNEPKVHPAAPAVIIGASLEEFLRNWLEEQQFDLTTIKPSLDSYSQQLKKLNLIEKQDVKDITSWGGIRNDAAHGHWENVNDRQRIKGMLEAVNLFMRKYSRQ